MPPHCFILFNIIFCAFTFLFRSFAMTKPHTEPNSEPNIESNSESKPAPIQGLAALRSLPKRMRSSFIYTALALLVAPSAFAFNSGSTGADGALAPTVNTQITLPESGILNYTTVNIPAGVTVTFKKNTLNTPVYLLASGDVTVAGTVAINGTNGANSGTSGDGSQADDGLPGVGGPGGFDGGRGGVGGPAADPLVLGGAGLGPGGGQGGVVSGSPCSAGLFYQIYVGASAGYATAGNTNPSPCGSMVSIRAGVAYGSPLLQPLIGGSGGGGGRGGLNYSGSGGGGGGGALLVASSGTITLSGSINAAGGNSGDTAGTDFGGPGGGGSGGAVRIVATRVAGAGSISARFGCTNGASSGVSYIYNVCSYYYGSNGRIRIEGDAITYTGTSTPSYVADVPGPVFLASLPSLRIATVAGTTVPDNPTGNADVVLPTNVANPVTVTFQTVNVPAGNTVLLRLIPAYGSTTEVLSPAITGTTASGTASVQVSLPQGPSTLQATTTYTIVVAMGEALSRFAQNERVEKVQLIATLGGEQAQAKLITVSGKEYLVPASVLQMVGFAA
jgi:hypothetical protein